MQRPAAEFDPAAYGPVVAAWLGDQTLMPLGPGTPEPPKEGSAREMISPKRVFGGRRVIDQDMAAACCAGLWLYRGYLDESHTVSQSIDTPTGSYWHALLHRREPDPSNAAYWFRRVADHPIFETLAKQAQDLGLRLRSDRWNPFDFIDLCEEHRGTGTEEEMLLRHVQRKEWELLFDWCFRRATGKE